MKRYSKFGFNDFYLALGYKAELVKEYFLHYRSLNADFTINLGNGQLTSHQNDNLDWNVTLVNTGLDSMTGGRVLRMQPFIKNEPFLLTYGDGVSDIDIEKLVAFHKSHGKLVTVSAVHPSARFGELEIDGNQVNAFKEKPQTNSGWINGGYFVVEPEFFDLIENDSTVLEEFPLEKAAELGQLMSYKHEGFWQCMDTKRDKDMLDDLWDTGKAPWAF